MKVLHNIEISRHYLAGGLVARALAHERQDPGGLAATRAHSGAIVLN